jgi:hypothetical protein
MNSAVLARIINPLLHKKTMNPVTLAQVIIPLLPSIAGDISDLVQWISKVRTAAKQTGEWTEDMDIKFRTCLIASGQGAAYKQ